MKSEKEFTHFDEAGKAIMVDVGDKEITKRVAIARGSIEVGPEVLSKIKESSVEKGDVLGVARIAGIMAVKQTSSLIPMCHPLLISKAKLDFEINDKESKIDAICQVQIEGKTGVEMEALTGVSIALLTIYDMCKAIDKAMAITDVHLVEKKGGKSGDFIFEKRK